MATTTLLCSPKSIFKQTHSTPALHKPEIPNQTRRPLTRELSTRGLIWNPKPVAGIVGSVLALALAGSASATELPPFLLGTSLPHSEPANALSLPTWAIHVSSVVEWITAMALVWQYEEKSGFESWKGLSWVWYLYLVEHFVHVHGISFTILNLLRYCWPFKLH